MEELLVDTAAMHLAREKGALLGTVCNTPGSQATIATTPPAPHPTTAFGTWEKTMP